MVQPPVVMGRRLQPFSLIHSLTLEHFDSPFLKQDKTPTRADTILAALICSKTWAELQSFFFNNLTTSRLRLPAIFSHCYRWQKSAEKLAAYFTVYLEMPERYWRNDKDDCLKSPWQYAVVRILCNVYHFTEEQAWNMPVNRAQCYADVHGEASGCVQLRSADDIELSRLVEALNDAEAKQDVDRIARLNKAITDITHKDT
jgi:hypothetical protein